jgi:hypothetical protein
MTMKIAAKILCSKLMISLFAGKNSVALVWIKLTVSSSFMKINYPWIFSALGRKIFSRRASTTTGKNSLTQNRAEGDSE